VPSGFVLRAARIVSEAKTSGGALLVSAGEDAGQAGPDVAAGGHRPAAAPRQFREAENRSRASVFLCSGCAKADIPRLGKANSERRPRLPGANYLARHVTPDNHNYGVLKFILISRAGCAKPWRGMGRRRAAQFRATLAVGQAWAATAE
jgi:hypothetical protein